MSLTRCPKCHNIVPSENKFCVECGTPRPSAGWVSSEPADEPQFSDTDQSGKSVHLRPEERRRIYEEEKARIEAQEQVRAEMAAAKAKSAKLEVDAKATADAKKSTDKRNGCLVLLGVLVLLAVVGSLSNHGSSPPPAPTPAAAPEQNYWSAREVVQYDTTKYPPVPRWDFHRGADGLRIRYTSRGACELAVSEHQQLIRGNVEWQCIEE